MRLPILAAFSLFLLGAGPCRADAPPPATNVCHSPDQAVHEKGFITIGGIQQWVTIDGDKCANPVVLMVHGGPGNPMSLFAGKIYGAWEKDYTMVQWDQRGAGMTYGKNHPSEDTPLTFGQITNDGIELSRYLTQHLGKRKVIIMGGSWSSIIAITMIRPSPTCSPPISAGRRWSAIAIIRRLPMPGC